MLSKLGRIVLTLALLGAMSGCSFDFGGSNEIRYDTGTSNGIGFSGGGPITVAVHFNVGKLSSYVGREITAIKYRKADLLGDSYPSVTVHVYGSGGSPGGAALATGGAADQGYGWHTVSLDTPVTINSGTDLWITYSVTLESNHNSLSADDGSAHADGCNYYNYGAGWMEETEYNFNLRAVLG